MSKRDDVVRELELLCVDLSDELARAEEALVLLTGKGKKKASASVPTGLGSQIVCEECGRQFSSTQGLGAHKRNAHGIGGDSTRTQARQRQRAERQPVRQMLMESMRKVGRPVSSGELAEMTGLNRKSVSAAITFFKRTGLVEEAGIERKADGHSRAVFRITEGDDRRSLIESLAPDMSGDNQREVVPDETPAS